MLNVAVARVMMLLAIALAVVGTACASGPSAETVAAGREPVTTTTTEPPPEGVAIVRIVNGAFRPSNLKLDLDEASVVEFRHEDDPEVEYVIEWRDDVFEASPPITGGGTHQVDFAELDPNIYRYFAFVGRNRIPGSVDTRPSQ